MVANYLYQSSITAIRGEARAMNVIASNIANATTPGHKAESTLFSDLLVERNGSTLAAFRGTNSRVRTDIYKEGIVTASAGEFDIALSGKGFFVVNSELDGTGRTLLTDSGEFQRTLVNIGGEEQAFITDSAGNFVQGFPFDTTSGTFNTSTALGSTSPIRIDEFSQVFLPEGTTAVTIDANLPPDTLETQFFDIGFTVFDGTGTADGISDAREVNARFTKTANVNEWTIDFSGDDATINSPAGSVTMTFDATGNVVSPTTQALDVTFANPAASNSLTIDFSNMQSFANQFVLREASNNGFLEGNLDNTIIQSSGVVLGTFTNGQTRPVAKIPIADLVNPESLVQATDTHFSIGANSGEITLFEVDQTDRATIISSALENSTTDIATEFTKLIMTQQAYNSAARTLKTVDDLLETATNLK
ncbi:MAG: flagellar hook-basal body complex protein [Alphaproteobacteria bacterium]